MAKSNVWDLSKKKDVNRTFTVYDNVDKKDVVLDCSFVPAGVTIDVEDRLKPMIKEQNLIYGRLRKLVEEATSKVKDLEEVPEETKEVIQELELKREELITEIGQIRFDLALKVLSSNGNAVDEDWLLNHLDESTLREVCVHVPDITLDMYLDPKLEEEYKEKKSRSHRTKR